MKKIRLSKIASENLTNRQMKVIKGGGCYCSCCKKAVSYDNGPANAVKGLNSPESSPCEGGGYWLPEVTVVYGG